MKKLWDFLGSRKLSVFIFIAGITFSLILFIFGMIVPVWWVDNISSLLPFKVLYGFFFVNLIICEIKWIPVIVKRCRPFREHWGEEALKDFRHKVEIASPQEDLSLFTKRLRRIGYTVKPAAGSEAGVGGFAPDGKNTIALIRAFRGRFSPLGNIIFHIAFILLLAGVGGSMFFRFEGRAKVTEGYTFQGTAESYKSIKVAPFATVPRSPFYLKKITPRFWEDEMLFTELRADITVGKREGSAWMSSPLAIDGSNITIQGLGMTPMYILKSREGRVIDRGYVNLGIFIPGSEDHFQIPGFPHQIFVSFYPDHEVVDGRPVNRSMNPNKPLYLIRIFRGKLPLFTGTLKPGEEAEFDNLKISFPEFIYWGDFRIIKDPGSIFVWTAFAFFGIGLVWRLIFYRREIVLVKGDDGYVLYGNSDYYPRLFENSLRSLGTVFS